MTHSEDSAKDTTTNLFNDAFFPLTPQPQLQEENESMMDIEQQEIESDAESTISTSLPCSFLSSPGIRSLEQRRVSTPLVTTPQHSNSQVFLEAEREAAFPKRRVLMTIPQGDDDDVISTPTKIHGPGLGRPSFSRSGSLLSKMHESVTQLGKHPQTPSPGDEPGARTKGPKTSSSNEIDRPPSLLDFSLPDTPRLDRGAGSYSPIPPPNFGTPPGTPSRTNTFGFNLSQSSPIASVFGLGTTDDNPFLGTTKKARFDLDYLSESQWYSDYPHHLTIEYLEDLFHLERRVMFTKVKSGSRDYPDYLKTNFYVNEVVLGMGDFSDVLKVQSKHTKEFFAVKRLIRTVQGAMESLKSALISQKKYGGFDEKRTWKCLTDLASGICAIHDSNIIHLDIKPGNVFITSAGSLKIGDFGHSITYPVEVKDINEGDKYYMAQELLNGYCGRFSDIFSLGMTIYEIITNQTDQLPGEGQRWHYLRDGAINMDEYTLNVQIMGQPELLEPSSGISSEIQKSIADSPIESSLSAKPATSRRQFSQELIDLVKEMLKPEYEDRPTANSILKEPTIQRVLSKKVEQGRRGGRSDEAMKTTEAAIIVSVLLSFLSQVITDDDVMRKRLARQVWAGTGLGLLVSLGIGAAFIIIWDLYGKNLWAASEGIWVGCFSLVAVFMITVMGIAMLRTNQMHEKWKVKLTKAMDDENAHGLGNRSRKYALFLLPLVTVLREGLEAVVFIGGVTFDAEPMTIPVSVFSGVILGLLIGFAIYRGGNRMQLHPFFVGSTCLLLLIAAGLVSKGIAAFESDYWNRVTGAMSDDEGTYDPRYNLWALKCCDPKRPDAGWWSVANALVGWSNIASYWSVGSYIMYWGIISTWLIRSKNKRVKSAIAAASAERPLLSSTGENRASEEDEDEVGNYRPAILSSSNHTSDYTISGGDDHSGVTRRHEGYGSVAAGTANGRRE
ncbi:high-affinity iron permease [Entomortierella beljakovae]|nr:high-affinity iron permease [Entomortierella beljakovae]